MRAMTIIGKQAEEKLEWGKDLNARLENNSITQASNIMVMPWVRRMAKKYHERCEAEKRKHAEKQENERQKRFAAKGKGQWEISKSMRGESASPLTALRRKTRGPRGQAPGTITTDPKEVDAIVRGTSGKIYAGNINNKYVNHMMDN